MKISRKNYESWFIDYSDGTLTAEQRAELLLFLEEHPDLKAEFENFVNELLPLLPPQESLPETFSASLKRGDITESNLSYYLIASMEGDLNAEEQSKLDSFLKVNPHLQRQQQLVALTHLQPAEEIYPAKAELKKPVPMLFSLTRTVKYAVAAMLVLTVVAGSYVIYTKTVSTPAVQMAEDQSSFDSSALSKDLKSDPAIQVRIEGSAVGSNEDQSAVGQSAAGSNKGLKDTVNQKTNVVKDEVKRELNRQRILQRTRPEYPLAQQQELPREEVQPKPEENLALQQPAETGQPALASNSEPAAGDEYVSVWDAIRGSAEKKARRFAGQDEEEAALAAAAGDRRSRPRLLDLIGKGVEKVSKEKVKYDSQYDSNGNLSALNVNAGWFGIEKTGE